VLTSLEKTAGNKMTDVLTIGVDIGGTRTKYGLVNTLTGAVIHTVVQPTEKQDEVQFLKQVDTAIGEFKAVALQIGCSIKSIGFGVPGFVNEEGVVETTYGFLAFMESYPLRSIIEKQFGISCSLDNDARTVCLGEALYGKGKHYKRVLTLTLGTGVGFGLVVNGHFTDPLPVAHMGGDMKINDDGDACYCGKKGCLEALVSSTGILSLARHHNWNGSLLPFFFLPFFTRCTE
jgi:glucokinase